MQPIPVLAPEQAAAWDRRTVEAGLAEQALMESAGRGVVAVLTTRFESALRRGTLVACGAGNNGGDGWVVARALHALGYPVWVTAVAGEPSPLAARAAALARQSGVRDVAADGPWPTVGLAIDALLGTGARGAPRPPMRALLERLGDLAVPTVAIDGPTGLDLATGISHGALPAALTITFGGYRRGHLLARDEVGDLIVLDIGFARADPAWPRLFTADSAGAAAGPLPARSHKGTRGRVVIVGGQPGMTGAARLAARAAFAAGAGLVHVAAPAESLSVVAAAEPDVQTAPLDFAGPIPEAAARLLASADAVVIGPGLGRHPSRRDFVVAVAERVTAPIVLDADGLMAFAGDAGRLADLGRSAPLVLTPHAGEFRALFPEWAPRLAVDPWGLAVEAAATCGATMLLKGVPTVVASPGGDSLTVAAGNPGLATGGSGDTLSGAMAALLAQGVEPLLAAATAAQALGDAAEIAARRSAARSLRPMDVVATLADVWREWARARAGPPARGAPVLHELPAPTRV